MWDVLIKINPNFITICRDDDEYHYRLALDKGYKITEKDLIKHKNLRNSRTIMEKAVEINPNFIKYMECLKINSNDYAIVDDAINNGYIPKFEDLEKNNMLGISKKLVTYLMDNGYLEALKYSKISLPSEYIQKALKVYTPTYKDLIVNPSLGNNDEVMKILLKENINAIVYHRIDNNYSGNEELIQYALNNGYVPTIDDIKYNETLARSKAILEKIIPVDSKAILYYKGNDSDVFKLALQNGYEPKKEDLEKNFSLRYSDDIMSILINSDYNNIVNYQGDNDELFNQAYNLGFTEDRIIEYLKTNKRFFGLQILKSTFVFKKILEKDVSLFEYYDGKEKEIFELALKKGYLPSEEMFKKYSNNSDFYECVTKYCIDNVKYFNPGWGQDFNVIINAVSLGYIPTEQQIEKFQNTSSYVYNALISKLINKRPEYIKDYTGDDLNTYKIALEKGYLPNEKMIQEKLSKDFDAMILVAKLKPEYIEYYYDSNARVLLKILALDYIPTYEEVKSNSVIQKNYEVMKKLISIDCNYVDYIDLNLEQTKELYELAFKKGYKPDLNNLREFICYPEIMLRYLIETDHNLIDRYPGKDIHIFSIVLDKYPKLDVEQILKINSSIKKANNLIIYLLRTKDYEVLKKESVQNIYDFNRVFAMAIELGYVPTIKEINNDTCDSVNINLLKKIVDNSNTDDCINKLCFLKYSDEEVLSQIRDYIVESKNLNFTKEYFDILQYYNYNKSKFVFNFSIFRQFLKNVNISEKEFMQYAFLINYDWFSDMLNIYNTNMEQFVKVKDFFFNNYYKISEKQSSVSKIKSFISILKNYANYSELCNDIINNSEKLTEDTINNINYLFNNNDILIAGNKPKSIEDLQNINKIFENKYRQELVNIENRDISEIKNVLCKLLFNSTYEDSLNILKIYGGTKGLRQLLFENRKNINLVDEIMEMMIYTSMMENVVHSNNKEDLINVANKILDNYQMSVRCMMLFSDFDEKMRSLYEKELNENLTRLKTNVNKNILDGDLTSEYGVEVIDFTDKKYCLLEHTISRKETVEELVNGIATGEKNTICLSVGSHRNQVVYNSNSIIFATDEIPSDSFLRSSTENMSSNGSIGNNSFEDSHENGQRTQRGALKTSEAGNRNSEVLCFREGIRFKYIVLPGGRKPTEEELEIAKKYNLKFVKVQSLEKSILNPKDIEEDNLREKEIESNSFERIEKLKKLKESLLVQSHGPKQIAIFTDSHALFEPTLAILEDARRSGITEIYSLGDNIGTGPNPGEVVELLEDYGVKSLKGNHELYATSGVDQFRSHLISAGGEAAYNEALRNSSWTRSQLTEEQLSKIESDPEDIFIEIGGKKVLLSHFTRDYNTGEEKNIPEDVDRVFQGHKHFESNDETRSTVRGAGIGGKDQEKSKAYYIVLTERPDGGYDIERRVIEYDTKSLSHDINESTLASEDKEKITSWAGVTR